MDVVVETPFLFVLTDSLSDGGLHYTSLRYNMFLLMFLELRIEQNFVDWLREKERKGKRKKPEGKDKGKARPWHRSVNREARKPEMEKSKNVQVPHIILAWSRQRWK